mgnify:CR=1 FL=1
MKQLIDLLKATPIERMEGNSQVRIIDVTADSRAVVYFSVCVENT